MHVKKVSGAVKKTKKKNNSRQSYWTRSSSFGIYRGNNHSVNTCICFANASQIASINCPLRLWGILEQFRKPGNISLLQNTVWNIHKATLFFKLMLYVFNATVCTEHLSQYPHLSSTAVSWQHGADLNILAIQLLASLHLSLQCGRVECIEWSDEDTLEIGCYDKSSYENHLCADLVYFQPSCGWFFIIMMKIRHKDYDDLKVYWKQPSIHQCEGDMITVKL